jgi:hypothetical protein
MVTAVRSMLTLPVATKNAPLANETGVGIDIVLPAEKVAPVEKFQWKAAPARIVSDETLPEAFLPSAR